VPCVFFFFFFFPYSLVIQPSLCCISIGHGVPFTPNGVVSFSNKKLHWGSLGFCREQNMKAQLFFWVLRQMTTTKRDSSDNQPAPALSLQGFGGGGASFACILKYLNDTPSPVEGVFTFCLIF
jgi:hypothetical protein